MTGKPAEKPASAEPYIITEKNHPIRLTRVDKDAVYVMRKLNKAGFSSYLVGGGVRDLYLKRTPKDFDISTEARPGQIRKLFPNSSTIGRRFRLVQVFFKGGKIIEVSTLRSLSEHDLDGPEAVLAPNNTYGNLPEDAQRRDLSINSLIYEMENRTIIDYVGGVRDLDNSIIRIIGDPDRRIHRDPVRMMRAVRHSARTGFTIEPETWASICRNCSTITLCPPSRIRDELFKDLHGGSAEQWFELAVNSGLFLTLFPFYADILATSPPGQPACKEQLGKIMKFFDTTVNADNGSEHNRLSSYFVLALLMLPWAEVRYNLSRLKLKGPAFFQLSKSLRADIDSLLGRQLNLRRSLRQEMVTLLANLPQLVRFVQNNNAPRWLKKKSYYQRCALFHRIQQEAVLAEKSPKGLLRNLDHNTTSESRRQKNSGHSKRKTKPAFSPKKKGGVFGFRK